MWFLSRDGSDSPSCGTDELTACRTLDWLLDRFHNATCHLNETLLSLITDISLVINDTLIVSYIFISHVLK